MTRNSTVMLHGSVRVGKSRSSAPSTLPFTCSDRSCFGDSKVVALSMSPTFSRKAPSTAHASKTRWYQCLTGVPFLACQ